MNKVYWVMGGGYILFMTGMCVLKTGIYYEGMYEIHAPLLVFGSLVIPFALGYKAGEGDKNGSNKDTD